MAKYFTVTVKSYPPHNTLWGIAEDVLGNGARYPEIMELNGLGSTVIHEGDVLKVYEIKEKEPEKIDETRQALRECVAKVEQLPEFQKLLSLL